MTSSQPSFQFTKMHGLGNDFIVINAIDQRISPEELPIALLAHRHVGIGFDQLLLIELSTVADFRCRIFNADGSEAEQCGNGLRCAARFIYDEGLSQNMALTLETKAGIFPASIQHQGVVQVALGVPLQGSPFILELFEKELSVISMGNPHVVLTVAAIEEVPVASLGRQIATDAVFPQGTNVGFMEIVNRQHIRLRTYERGVGETFACGSNTCAAVAAGVLNGLLDTQVRVELAFGYIDVSWGGISEPISMTGPTAVVFEGSCNWEQLLAC
jgi:diaminopimelate epimerase